MRCYWSWKALTCDRQHGPLKLMDKPEMTGAKCDHWGAGDLTCSAERCRDNHDRPLQPEAKSYQRNPPSGQDVDRPDIFRLDGREESLLLHVAEEGHESNPYKRPKTDNKEQELLMKEPPRGVLFLLGKLYHCRLHHGLLRVLNPVNTMILHTAKRSHSLLQLYSLLHCSSPHCLSVSRRGAMFSYLCLHHRLILEAPLSSEELGRGRRLASREGDDERVGRGARWILRPRCNLKGGAHTQW